MVGELIIGSLISTFILVVFLFLLGFVFPPARSIAQTLTKPAGFVSVVAAQLLALFVLTLLGFASLII